MKYQIGIYIKPPQKLSEKINTVKQYLYEHHKSAYSTEAHISLYIGAIKSNKFSALVKAIKDVKSQSFEVTIDDFYKNIHHNKYFYGLSIKKNKDLETLHRTLLPIVNKYRDHLMRTKDIERLKTNHYQTREKNYILKYGYSRVLRNYTPHITIGLISKTNKKLENKLSQELKDITNKKFKVKNINIALFEEEKLQEPIRKNIIKFE